MKSKNAQTKVKTIFFLLILILIPMLIVSATNQDTQTEKPQEDQKKEITETQNTENIDSNEKNHLPTTDNAEKSKTTEDTEIPKKDSQIQTNNINTNSENSLTITENQENNEPTENIETTAEDDSIAPEETPENNESTTEKPDSPQDNNETTSQNNNTSDSQNNNEEENETENSTPPSVTVSIKDTSIKEDEEIEITIILKSESSNIEKIEINYNDGSNSEILDYSGTGSFLLEKEHKYSQAGTYKIDIIVSTENEIINKSSEEFHIEKAEEKNYKPSIILLSPKRDEIITKTDVIFKFRPKDDQKISECTFIIYKMNKTQRNVEYQESFTQIENDKEIIVDLKEFEYANYSWKVECIDNNLNSRAAYQKFSIIHPSQTNDYETVTNKITEEINSFLTKTKEWTLSQKNIFEILNIKKRLENYKKDIISIKKELEENINFIVNEEEKKQKKEEKYKELEKISNNIPKEIEIKKQEKYVKNEPLSLYNIISNYTNFKKKNIEPYQIKELSDKNEKLQGKISITTNIQEISINYKNKTEKIILIEKELELNNNSNQIILEIIPEKLIEKINFITEPKTKYENIYEFETEKLNKNKIIYYFKEDVDLKKIRESETILFQNFKTSSNKITGFFYNINNSEQSPYLNLALTILIISLLIFSQKKKIKNFITKKNDEEIKSLYKIIKRINDDFKNKNYEEAKDKYLILKEIYKKLKKENKLIIYKTLRKIKTEIDKEDIKNFIREYEKNKKENNIESANFIYKKIKEKYKELPKKYQATVYNRLINN